MTGADTTEGSGARLLDLETPIFELERLARLTDMAAENLLNGAAAAKSETLTMDVDDFAAISKAILDLSNRHHRAAQAIPCLS